eukprot:TRINITY_DN1657_c2_g1_i1.p1 TRINITY_DN1657_c2_g1~~TRINITY_DN1657_c2_g1_i1.p1  ORF type:complete len:198 (-),score=33.29 TRINITY_DN1657_c2_g1_i1:137-730(-)
MGEAQSKTSPNSLDRSSTSTIPDPAQLKRDIDSLNEVLDHYLHGTYVYTKPETFDHLPPIIWPLFVQIILRGTDGQDRRLNVKQFLQLHGSINFAQKDHRTSSADILAKAITPFDEHECCVCMERTAQVVLSCEHEFCESCISVWRKKSHTCPICRTTLGDDSIEDWVLTDAEVPNEDLSDYLRSCLAQMEKSPLQP